MVTSYSTAPQPAVERAENYADDLSGSLAVGDYGNNCTKTPQKTAQTQKYTRKP